MPEISLKEWKFVGLLGLILIIVVFLPILIGLIATPPGEVFIGLQSINHTDTPVYYSWIEQTKDGHFLFKNLFTSEDEGRFIFDPFWLGVGIFAKIFSLSSFAAYQLVKIFLIPVFLAIAYIFISYFFTEEKKRKVCFLFLIFATGLGWVIWLATNIFSLNLQFLLMDLWVPEAFTFSTLYNSPHFIASLTFFLAILFLILLAIEKNKKIYSFAAGLAGLFLFQFHPYNAPTIFGILGLYFLFLCIKNRKIRWDILSHYFIFFIFSSPAIIYHLWTLQNFWTRREFALQNICLLPSPIITILSYGFLLLLACLGVFVLLKKQRREKEIFLLAWFVAQIILIYSPLNFQRRLTAGLQILLAILSVTALYFLQNSNHFLNNFFRKKKITLCLLFIVFLGGSNYFLFLNDITYYLNPPQIHSPYLSLGEKEAMLWLKNNSLEKSIVLAAPTTGNLIPAVSLRPVYVGQWSLTAAQTVKTEWLKKFFSEFSDRARAGFLKINKIDYFFYGPAEKSATNLDPDQADYLEKVYQNEEVTIYKVKQ